jgi:hypothetical protein
VEAAEEVSNGDISIHEKIILSEALAALNKE